MPAENPERIAIVWSRFTEDDKEAFAEIYNTFVDDLFRYGTKICPDEEMVKDAIQEVFMDLYLNRRNKKKLATNLKFYLILAMKRNLIRKLQKNRKTENRFVAEADLFDAQYSFEEQLIAEESDREVNKKIQEAMEQLPPRQKEAIYLRYNQSLEYEQIAGILNISVESVRKQVYRAVKSVRDCLGGNGLILFSFLKKRFRFERKDL
ncbi:RNA polymerase sigma factor [Gaoshiqia sp. Z1-71]|uniref:RNA polymerase sigma factor n=1 Tax=Gaoshiqia hydrogeniformans TaxID=3290090 RepID=UPI003BF8C143